MVIAENVCFLHPRCLLDGDVRIAMRFSVIAGLLASPPEYGKLKESIKLLASQTWKHPFREERLMFHWSTIERWYYRANHSNDPIDSLTRKMRLDLLNRSTQAWVELEYNRRRYRELKSSPIDSMLAGPSVSFDCPDSEKPRMSFCTQVKRTKRRSDGTITISGIRFEISSRIRHLQHIFVLHRPQVYYTNLKEERCLTHIDTEGYHICCKHFFLQRKQQRATPCYLE